MLVSYCVLSWWHDSDLPKCQTLSVWWLGIGAGQVWPRPSTVGDYKHIHSEWGWRLRIKWDLGGGYVHLYNSNSGFGADDKYERWNKIPVSLKKKAAQLMHVSAFWYHILLCRENHNSTCCASGLPRFKLLEDQTRHMIWISNRFNLSNMVSCPSIF